MKVTQVSIRPTDAAIKAKRLALTPELLAASGARYSRNNEGLDSILSKIEFDNHDETFEKIKKALDHQYEGENLETNIRFALDEKTDGNMDTGVDSIFNMIDYGHQSIADMTPVAMFIDGISIFAAYYIWSVSPVAGGQESSTRYIRMDLDGVVTPNELGIPLKLQSEWQESIKNSFELYNRTVEFWEQVAIANPAIMNIPQTLIDDSSSKAQKQVARMRRNYAFDRSRYFLPIAAATNMMMVQSARQWVILCQWLMSSPLREFQTIGSAIASELWYSAPRLIKHATANEVFIRRHVEAYDEAQHVGFTESIKSIQKLTDESKAYLVVNESAASTAGSIEYATHGRSNRYSPFGTDVNRTQVRFGWTSVSMAEIRDLNRHRTGTKWCPLAPIGFYSALDQVPEQADDSKLESDSWAGYKMNDRARELLITDELSYPYFTNLGAQYPFEHATTANHFLYEAELRTGTGAHYRYAKHLRDTLELWYNKYPDTRGRIFQGSAEPE